MLGSCIGVAVIAVLYEALKVLRERIDAKRRCATHGDSDAQAVTEDGGKSMTIIDSSAAVSQSHHCHAKEKYATCCDLHQRC